jgi:hypothetical protein
MVLLGLLAAMMLAASPVIAHQGGQTHGDKYSKNYYPSSFYNYCDPEGDQWLGSTKANQWCDQWYTDYKTKWINGKKYYYVHVYYEWKTTRGGQWQEWDGWYYCQYHQYDDPEFGEPYFKAWVTYKPTGDHNWEWFYNEGSTSH